MKKLLLSALLGLSCSSLHAAPIVSMYWCGPDAGCGGQSTDFSDVNPKVTHVFVAFGVIDGSGNVSFTLNGMSNQQFMSAVQSLQSQGKKVVLSLGGQNANWAGALANPQAFANSLYSVMTQFDFDGADMDIESSNLATLEQAEQLISLLKDTRADFNQDQQKHLLITVSPEATTVVNNVPNIGGGWNTMVPVINNEINDIDFIQVQAYNDNPFGDTPGTQTYLTDIYNDWIQPFTLGSVKYNGLDPKKLVLGMPASNQAANPSYYPGAAVISSTITHLMGQQPNFAGVMFWDSHWDALNNDAASNAAINALKPQN